MSDVTSDRDQRDVFCHSDYSAFKFIFACVSLAPTVLRVSLAPNNKKCDQDLDQGDDCVLLE